jgi:hypothetical protein
VEVIVATQHPWASKFTPLNKPFASRVDRSLTDRHHKSMGYYWKLWMGGKECPPGLGNIVHRAVLAR